MPGLVYSSVDSIFNCAIHGRCFQWVRWVRQGFQSGLTGRLDR